MIIMMINDYKDAGRRKEEVRRLLRTIVFRSILGRMVTEGTGYLEILLVSFEKEKKRERRYILFAIPSYGVLSEIVYRFNDIFLI